VTGNPASFILAQLREHGTRSVADLLEAGWSTATLYPYLRTLLDRGLIVRVAPTRPPTYSLPHGTAEPEVH
jgi:hypothetical protein